MFGASILCFAFLASGVWAQSTRVTIVDLTHELHEDVPRHPVYVNGLTRNTTISERNEEHGFSYQYEEICQPTHLGTHIDAPRHFTSTSWSVTDIPLERLMLVPAAVVDMRHKVFLVPENKSEEDSGQSTAEINPDAQLTIQDLEEWEAKNGRLPENSVLLVYTDWERYWNDSPTYLGGSVANNLRHPGLSPEAAEWLIKERPTVYGVGVDMVSVDYGLSKDYKCHQVLTGANVYILENLANLGRLPPKGAFLYIGAVKLGRGASGVPIRAVATIYEKQ